METSAQRFYHKPPLNEGEAITRELTAVEREVVNGDCYLWTNSVGTEAGRYRLAVRSEKCIGEVVSLETERGICHCRLEESCGSNFL